MFSYVFLCLFSILQLLVVSRGRHFSVHDKKTAPERGFSVSQCGFFILLKVVRVGIFTPLYVPAAAFS